MESSLTPIDHAVLLPFVAALGLVFGSFVTALSYRLPRGISIAHGRSRCPACGTTLTAQDLIPVLSWLMHRRACRHCGSRIPWRYPGIEVLTALLFVIAALVIDDPLRLALVLCATPIFVTLSVIDIEMARLPNVLVVSLVPIAVGLRYLDDGAVVIGVATAVITVAFAWMLDIGAKKLAGERLGAGDGKLMAVAALALPLVPFFATLLAAGVLGIFVGVIRRLRRLPAKSFPFGPAILAGFWLALIAL